jgi:hypothetical protein
MPRPAREIPVALPHACPTTTSARTLGARTPVGVRVVKEDVMNAINWNAVIQTLVLVRLGQELGTDSRLARALHEMMQALLGVWR